MTVIQITLNNLWAKFQGIFRVWRETIEYNAMDYVKDQVKRENPEMTETEIEELTKEELQRIMPQYYMYMHWPFI